MKTISQNKQKNDRLDARTIADLLRTNFFAEAYALWMAWDGVLLFQQYLMTATAALNRRNPGDAGLLFEPICLSLCFLCLNFSANNQPRCSMKDLKKQSNSTADKNFSENRPGGNFLHDFLPLIWAAMDPATAGGILVRWSNSLLYIVFYIR